MSNENNCQLRNVAGNLFSSKGIKVTRTKKNLYHEKQSLENFLRRKCDDARVENSEQ